MRAGPGIAEDLRERQKRIGKVPTKQLEVISDEDLCWCYVTCPECQQRLTPSLRKLIKEVRTADRFVEAANMLLAIHQIEVHGANVVKGDPATELKPVGVTELKADLEGHLRKSESVWDTACSWSDTQFPDLEGRNYSHAELQRQMENHLSEYPGLSSRKWLFVYSPHSANTLFEVSGDFIRISIAITKLVTVAKHGGMIFGVNDSGEFRRVVPLIVCKPNEQTS